MVETVVTVTPFFSALSFIDLHISFESQHISSTLSGSVVSSKYLHFLVAVICPLTPHLPSQSPHSDHSAHKHCCFLHTGVLQDSHSFSSSSFLSQNPSLPSWRLQFFLSLPFIIFLLSRVMPS